MSAYWSAVNRAAKLGVAVKGQAERGARCCPAPCACGRWRTGHVWCRAGGCSRHDHQADWPTTAAVAGRQEEDSGRPQRCCADHASRRQGSLRQVWQHASVLNLFNESRLSLCVCVCVCVCACKAVAVATVQARAEQQKADYARHRLEQKLSKELGRPIQVRGDCCPTHTHNARMHSSPTPALKSPRQSAPP